MILLLTYLVKALGTTNTSLVFHPSCMFTLTFEVVDSLKVRTKGIEIMWNKYRNYERSSKGRLISWKKRKEKARLHINPYEEWHGEKLAINVNN